MNRKVSLKSISDFEYQKIKFYIPGYQRGYRWKSKQVCQLIDDIEAFTPTEATPFYFLQALAVAEDSIKNRVNVVDGQQRLTTLKLILGEEYEGIQIEYAREADKALDKYFKDSAKKIIEERLGDAKDTRRIEFCEKLKSSCRFLYYVVEAEKELDTFDELNSGKIPAKDSELVKCVMLTLGSDESTEITNSRANEWDDIERMLNNDSFFAWITPRGAWRENDRMTILLRYAGINPSKKEIEDEVFPFLSVINEKLKSLSRRTVWKKIYSAYYILFEWYNDPLMYHALGATVHKRNNKAITPITGKSNIISLIEKMKNKFTPNNDRDDYSKWDDKLFDYLLLCNVAYSWKRWPNRYSFKRHRQIDLWSIEHIFARNQRDLTEEELKDWFGDNISKEKIKEYQDKCKEGKGDEWLEEKLEDKYPKEEDNSIYNLALLPKDANSSLNNKLFEGKRNEISKWANERWATYWAPPATEAVFMKSLVGLKMTVPFWSEEDKTVYYDSMKKDIEEFFTELKKVTRL